MSKIRIQSSNPPSFPPVGKYWIYIDSADGHLKKMDSNGVITDYDGIAASGWELSGNSGNSSLNFLGTIDAQPINIRTDNNQIAQFDINGRFGIGPDAPLSTFYIKPYVGYTGSGTRLDSFALTTNTSSPSNLYGIVLTNGSVAKVTLEVTGRQSDGTARCSFTRSGLFYKEGGNVALQGPVWQSDFSSKSNSLFNVSYVLGTNTISLKVSAASNVETYWTGNIKIEVLGNNI